MKFPSYLQRNHDGIFHFRRAVLAHLRASAGKREVVQSLRTRDPKIAAQRARFIAFQVENWLFEIAGLMGKKKETTNRTNFEIEFEFTDNTVKKASKRENPETIKAMSEAGCTPDQIAKAVSNFNAAPLPTPPSQGGVTAQPLANAEPAQAGVLLSKLVSRYEKGRRSRRPFNKTQRARYRRLVQILGDTFCSAVTRKHARMVMTQIERLPRNTTPFRGMHIDEILATSHKERMSVASIRHHMVDYGSLFKWAIREGLYPGSNPFEGLAPVDPIPANQKRDDFSRDELKQIFSGPMFTAFSPRKHKAHDYWAPLIGLFTGARTAEVGALAPDDAYQEKRQDGKAVWCIKFNIAAHQSANVRKRGKNANAIRAVPLHSRFVELGLPNFCASRKKLGKEMLFDLSWNDDDGYGRNIRDRFHAYLKKIEVSMPGAGRCSKVSVTRFRPLSNEPTSRSITSPAFQGTSTVANRRRANGSI